MYMSILNGRTLLIAYLMSPVDSDTNKPRCYIQDSQAINYYSFDKFISMETTKWGTLYMYCNVV